MWLPSLSRTAFTLLGIEFTRASQVATGMLYHSSMMMSRSWQIFETLHISIFRLRIPQRCSIGFKSGVIVMLEHYPATQFLEGGDHALLKYFTVHAGVHVSLNEIYLSNTCSTHTACLRLHECCRCWTFPPPWLPPPCLTVGMTHLSLYSSPGRCHTCLKPSEKNKLIFISSDRRTRFQ